MDEESGRNELVDDLMSEPSSDGSAAEQRQGEQRQWVQRVRMVWRAAIRWPYWPATVLVTVAVVGTLIYLAVGLIASFFSGVVE